MKKLIVLVLCMTLVLGLGSVQVRGEETVVEFEELKIIIDGENGEYEDVPLIVNDRTMLPLRAVVTRIGIENDDEHIIWNGEEQSVTLIKDDIEVFLQVGNLEAMINDEVVTLDVAPFVYSSNNRTYVPARFVSEAFDKKVLWDGKQKGVIITEHEEYNKIMEIFEQTDLAMADLTKVKLKMDYDILIDSPTDSMDLSMAIDMDLADEDYYMSLASSVNIDESTASEDDLMAAAMIEGFMNLSSYKVGTTSYTKMFLTGEQWIVAEEEDALAASDDGIIDVDDQFYASQVSNEVIASSTTLTESEDGKSYIIKGDTYQDDYINNLLGFVDGVDESLKINDFYMEYIINKETYYAERILFTMAMEMLDETGQLMKCEVSIDVALSDINEDFSIIVPEEVINNAVDAASLFSIDSLVE